MPCKFTCVVTYHGMALERCTVSHMQGPFSLLTVKQHHRLTNAAECAYGGKLAHKKLPCTAALLAQHEHVQR